MVSLYGMQKTVLPALRKQMMILELKKFSQGEEISVVQGISHIEQFRFPAIFMCFN